MKTNSGAEERLEFRLRADERPITGNSKERLSPARPEVGEEDGCRLQRLQFLKPAIDLPRVHNIHPAYLVTLR